MFVIIEGTGDALENIHIRISEDVGEDDTNSCWFEERVGFDSYAEIEVYHTGDNELITGRLLEVVHVPHGERKCQKSFETELRGDCFYYGKVYFLI